jgi:lysophospholipase L1-like esterase
MSERTATKRKRSLGKRLLFAAILILLSLAGLEIAIRVVAHVTLRGRGVQYDSELGWRMLPEIRKVGTHWSDDEPAWTNAEGFRDEAHAFEPPPGVRRIVALGDSFTAGETVDFGERFTEHLERDLESLEVVNLGTVGFGTDQELRLLELDGFRYQPDLVVLTAYLGNDMEDIRFARRWSQSKPYYRLTDAGLELVKPSLTWDVWIRNQLYLGEICMRLLDASVLPRSVPAPEWRDTDTVPLFLALVEDMHRRCDERGVEFVVLIAYNEPSVVDGLPDGESRARAGLLAADLAVVDTLQPFVERQVEGGEQLYADDEIHWNESGHALVGQLLRDHITRHHLLNR